MSKEKKLSEYIDKLNKEQKPIEHNSSNPLDEEYVELMNTVRAVKSLKEPQMPDESFENRLLDTVLQSTNSKKKRKNTWKIFITTAAAILAIVFLAKLYVPFGTSNAVYAMEQAFQDINAYHGILRLVETNELGEETIQSVREVWTDKKGNYYLKELEGSKEGLVTINNGKKKWQVRPVEKEVHILPLFPDSYRFTFEIGNEIDIAKSALEVKKIGEESIWNRDTIVYQVTPEGGDPYKLWIDKESNLPIQRQTSMQNAIQYTLSYVELEFTDSIPKELLTYETLDGYTLVKNSPEQIVSNLEEAIELTEFHINIPKELKLDYTLSKIGIELEAKRSKLYYESMDNTILVQQEKATKDLNPEASAHLGSVNGSTAEIIYNLEEATDILLGSTIYGNKSNINSIRWQEDGFEYRILGDIPMEELVMWVESISKGKVELPKETVDNNKPEIQVPIDMEIEENEQKSVDGGHSPWRLDPAYVTQVFASLLLQPEGIHGDYPIQYEEIEIIENNGLEAKAEIHNADSIAKTVYLKRLVRQDDTGIWTVVGYDK